MADDLGDEARGDRGAALDALEEELDRAFGGRARHPLLRRLAATIRACDLPREPLIQLIEANRRDQQVTRYESFEALTGYCALSANPVGRLVLQIFDSATPERIRWSDPICTALQIAEHCQDVAEDYARGRIYLPAEDRARAGCPERDLAAPTASVALREVIQCQALRARALLREGEPLIATLRGTALLSVAGFAAGGHAALDGLERIDFDVLGHRARSRRRDVLRHAVRLLRRGIRPSLPAGIPR